MVPVGGRRLRGAQKYMHEICPQFDLDCHDPAFFLTSLGEAFTPHMTQLVRNHINAAEIGEPGSCHLFRHSSATLMLGTGRYPLYPAASESCQARYLADLYTNLPTSAQTGAYPHPSRENGWSNG